MSIIVVKVHVKILARDVKVRYNVLIAEMY